MSVFAGDFLGFTLGEIHSEQLNITRVSSSDRYNDILTPTFQDSTVQVPGKDGTYFWDTFYTQRPFTIDFAFDDLRDEDLRRLRQIFGFKGVKPLVFDEFPYKKYMVKCSAPPTLKYICFDYQDIRIYKGEGSVNLVAYYPYGIGTSDAIFTHASEVVVVNDGDLESPLKFIYAINDAQNLQYIKLKDEDGTVLNQLILNGIQQLGNDTYILIDSKTHLIDGLDVNFNKTGNLYNRFVMSGDFFDMPLGKYIIESNVPFTRLTHTPLYY